MKLIDAEQAVTMELYDDEHEEYHKKIISIENMIATYTIEMELPTVDAVPVRHGKWTRHTVGSAEYGTTVMYRCNECEMVTISRFKYCPHCGARMDGNGKTD